MLPYIDTLKNKKNKVKKLMQKVNAFTEGQKLKNNDFKKK